MRRPAPSSARPPCSAGRSPTRCRRACTDTGSHAHGIDGIYVRAAGSARRPGAGVPGAAARGLSRLERDRAAQGDGASVWSTAAMPRPSAPAPSTPCSWTRMAVHADTARTGRGSSRTCGRGAGLRRGRRGRCCPVAPAGPPALSPWRCSRPESRSCASTNRTAGRAERLAAELCGLERCRPSVRWFLGGACRGTRRHGASRPRHQPRHARQAAARARARTGCRARRWWPIWSTCRSRHLSWRPPVPGASRRRRPGHAAAPGRSRLRALGWCPSHRSTRRCVRVLLDRLSPGSETPDRAGQGGDGTTAVRTLNSYVRTLEGRIRTL